MCAGCPARFSLAIIAALLLAGGCAPAPDQPFLSRPAPPPRGDERLAFTARGRVWIGVPGEAGEAGEAGETGAVGDTAGGAGDGSMPIVERWTARPVLAGVAAPRAHQQAHQQAHQHEDRPVWLPDGETLALSIWVDARADLALVRGDSLVNLTATADRSELLNDVSPDGRLLLFEDAGVLLEYELDSSELRRIAPGRDGRYTRGGRRIMFVRGHTRSRLGIWQEEYRGGDDSEIMLFDRVDGSLRALTYNVTNDEQPLPLDTLGRDYIAVSDRSEGYQPWFVEPRGPRVSRIRRPDLPRLDRPVRFPAVRWRHGGPLDLWYEQEGNLFRLSVARNDSALGCGPIARIDMRLDGGDTPEQSGWWQRFAGLWRREPRGPGEFGEELFGQLARQLRQSPLTRTAWLGLPRDVRRRYQAEMGRVWSRREAVTLLMRLCGRFGLSGLFYVPPWAGDDAREPVIESVIDPAAPDSLAAAVEALGLAWLAVDRFDTATLGRLERWTRDPGAGLVLDLRDCRGGEEYEAALRLLCPDEDSSVASEDSRLADASSRIADEGSTIADESSTIAPVIALISEATRSTGEIVADRLQSTGCGRLVGRPTAGMVLEVEIVPLEIGGYLSVPIDTPRARDGRRLEGSMVMPHHHVDPMPEPGIENWLDPILNAARRLGTQLPPSRTSQ